MRIARVCLLLICLGLLLPAGRARGDVLPDIMREDSRLPAMRFDNLADYPAFDFYLKYAVGRGNPYANPRLLRIQSGITIQPEGYGHIGEALLLAVPHGKQPPPVSDLFDSWSQAPAGCLQSPALAGVHWGEGYLVPYRVRIENDKLEVTMQSAELQPVGWTKVWLKRLPWIVAPLAFCAALGWLGARIARHLFPPKSASSAVESTSGS